jgi:hypothetical protein
MSTTGHTEAIIIRPARDSDEYRLMTLAQRDSAAVPAGNLLVAEVGGAIRAAVAVEGGAEIADPFHPTAGLLDLLRARAEQSRRRPGRIRIITRSHPRLARA